MTALRVVVDGAPLADGEARAFWKRFSEWMDGNPGDLRGFAAAEGLVSVHPAMQAGAPVLLASRTAAQRPYSAAATVPEAPGPARPVPPSRAKKKKRH